jgi:hypothetical protein
LIDGVQVYTIPQIGYGTFNYVFVKDESYRLRIKLNNINSATIALDLNWNIDGSYKVIDSFYMYPFTRETEIPYQLINLQSNTYCDDIIIFRCLSCDA